MYLEINLSRSKKHFLLLSLALLMTISCGEKDSYLPIGDMECCFPRSSFAIIDPDLSTGYKIQISNDGGFVVLTNEGRFNNEIVLTKFDDHFNKIWSQTYSEGSGREGGNDVIQTTDGGYIISGFTSNKGEGGNDAYILKADQSGEKMWSRAFGDIRSDAAEAILQISDGSGYLFVGSIQVSGTFSETAMLIVRLDNNGLEIWSKVFRKSFSDRLYSVVEQDNGEFMLLGRTSEFQVGGSFYVAKIDQEGNFIFEHIFDEFEVFVPGFTIIKTNDEGFAIASTIVSDQGSNDPEVFLLKLNNDGEKQWSRTYGGPGLEYIQSIIQTDDNDFVLVGATTSFGAGALDTYLLKTDEFGEPLWEKAYGGAASDQGYDIQLRNNGGYIISGISSLGNNINDFKLMLLQTNKDGIPE